MAVHPDSTTMAVYPMSRPPHIVGAAHVITGATSVIRSIADLDCDCARGAIPRITISWVRSVTWISRVPWSIPGIAAIIIISATAYPDSQGKE